MLVVKPQNNAFVLVLAITKSSCYKDGNDADIIVAFQVNLASSGFSCLSCLVVLVANTALYFPPATSFLWVIPCFTESEEQLWKFKGLSCEPVCQLSRSRQSKFSLVTCHLKLVGIFFAPTYLCCDPPFFENVKYDLYKDAFEKWQWWHFWCKDRLYSKAILCNNHSVPICAIILRFATANTRVHYTTS